MSLNVPSAAFPRLDASMSRVRIDISRPGVRAYIEMHGPIVHALKPGLWQRVLRDTMHIGAEMVRTHFLPSRFSNSSLVQVHNSKKWSIKKNWISRSALPQFVGLTPLGGGRPDGPWWQRNKAKMIESVFRTAKSKVFSKGPNRGAAMVAMSYGHGIRPEKAAAFKTIAPVEWEQMQSLMLAFLSDTIAGTTSYDAKRPRSGASPVRNIGVRLARNYAGTRDAYRTRAISSRVR
jgi:hypothetical protein